jgi:hypothetical protein
MRLLACRLTAAAVGCVALAAPLRAQNVVDQQQTTAEGSFGYVDGWNAQTFTPTRDNVSGAGFMLSSRDVGGFSGTATVALWSGNPSDVGSIELATGALPYVTGYDFEWFDTFWSPVAVTPGQTYWLLIGGGSWGTFTLFGQPTTYANGGAYYSWSTDRQDPYTDFSGAYDLTFRTYAVVTTPEPGTWMLLGAGLLGVGGIAARRRRTTA